MATRLKLQEKLESLLGTGNVYFQPPSTVRLCYPCIVYSLSDISVRHADNNPYSSEKEYKITIVDKDPDSSFKDILATWPKAKFNDHYTSNNLHHDVFTLFF